MPPNEFGELSANGRDHGDPSNPADGDRASLESYQRSNVFETPEKPFLDTRGESIEVSLGMPSLAAGLADSLYRTTIPELTPNPHLVPTLFLPNLPVGEAIADITSSLGFELRANFIGSFDLGLKEAVREASKAQLPLISHFQEQLELMARGINRATLPPNLRDLVGEVTAGEVDEFVRKEAIPLYLVPRSNTALRLLRAPGRPARRKILNDCFDSIIADCESVLEESQSEIVEEQTFFVLKGIEAMRAGYVFPAQAMFTVILDSLTTILFPSQHDAKLVKNHPKDAKAPRQFDQMTIIEPLVWLPVWNAHEEFWPIKGDPVPHQYSRHASVHAVTHRQFNKRNCVQSLMLVTSLVGYADNRW